MFDSLTVTMCCVVTFISTLVHLYSIEYMAYDPHLSRFMSYLSLFTFFIVLVSLTGIILSVLYTMFLYNRLVFGNLNILYLSIYKDMTRRETLIIMPLTILTLLLGIFPDLVFDVILSSVLSIIEKSKLV
jgi:NADH-quinone oxidoreductase subunit M